MNNMYTTDELSALVRTLLSEDKWQEALERCVSCAASTDDAELWLTAQLLATYCRNASGDEAGAVDEHRQVMQSEAARELTAIDRLGVAEEALDAHLPFDYCAELFCAAAQQFESDGSSPDLAAGAYNKAGICHFRNGSAPNEEQMCFRLALEASSRFEKDSGSDEHKHIILEALIKSNLAECLMRSGGRDEAVELYEQASEVFHRHLNEDSDMCLVHYAICQRCLSDIYRSSDENIKAHACLTRSITELDRRRDHISDQLIMHLAVCCNARGTLRFQMGDYEGEVEDCTRSLELREGLDSDNESLATVYSNRAEAYAMMDMNEDAKSDFFRAIELFDTIPDSGHAAAAAASRCFALGLMCVDSEEYDEAISYFRSSADRLAALRATGMDAGEFTAERLTELEALSRMRLANCISHLDERDYYDAVTESRMALALLEQLPVSVERYAHMTALHTSLGELMELFDEFEAAKDEYQQAAQCRTSGLELIISAAGRDQIEENPEEALEDEGSIWENFSGDTPQA